MKIQGLTEKQKMFCDIIYKFDYVDQIHDFIATLPEDNKKCCEVAFTMMLAAALDENTEIDAASEIWKDLRKKWKV
jgi:hypothetical protein